MLDRTEQLNTIFALSPDGFVSFDYERRVKFVNPALINMTALKGMRLEGMDEIAISAWLEERCSTTTPFCGIVKMREGLSSGGQDAPHGRAFRQNPQQIWISAVATQVVDGLVEQALGNDRGAAQSIETLENNGQGQDGGDD